MLFANVPMCNFYFYFILWKLHFILLKLTAIYNSSTNVLISSIAVQKFKKSSMHPLPFNVAISSDGSHTTCAARAFFSPNLPKMPSFFLPPSAMDWSTRGSHSSWTAWETSSAPLANDQDPAITDMNVTSCSFKTPRRRSWSSPTQTGTTQCFSQLVRLSGRQASRPRRKPTALGPIFDGRCNVCRSGPLISP
jgi:hypothetical protein